MRYRSEIDGLRAVAILPVVFFHGGFEIFSGGFVGVDVFFVISGYLITTLLLNEMRVGQFSMVNFYERRVRRIMPALLSMLLVTTILAPVVLLPSELLAYFKSLTSVPLFYANFFFWKDGSYFDEVAELKPLLHTWSLAVEEQYYLLFPPALLLLLKVGRPLALLIILIASAVSLLIAVRLGNSNPSAAFFLPASRFWEIGAGSLVAIISPHLQQRISSRFSSDLLSALGMVLILIAVFSYSSSTRWPGAATLLPVVGASLFILFSQSHRGVGRILSQRAFVMIGLISYSLYLWHQPVFAFVKGVNAGMSWSISLAAIALSVFLAWVSWRYIEAPFRDRNRVPRQAVWLVLGIGSLILVIVGLVGAIMLRPPSPIAPESLMARLLSSGKVVISDNVDERLLAKARIQSLSTPPTIIVIGSSRIMQIGEETYRPGVVNFGVSGASLEDLVALLHLASAQSFPQEIIIGVDPWLFNDKAKQDRWQSLRSDYLMAQQKLTQPSDNLAVLSHFSNAGVNERHADVPLLRSLYTALNIRSLEARDANPGFKQKIKPDGTIVYNLAYHGKTSEEVRRGLAALSTYSLEYFKYSTPRQAEFEAMLSFYKQHTRVVLALVPYHPGLYEIFVEERPVVLQMEKQIRDLAYGLGLTVIGSYNPSRANCTEEQFYDGMHPKPSCIKTLMTVKR